MSDDNGTNLPRCQGIKASGERCERVIQASQTHCYSHDKTRAAERKSNASKAAKSKLSSEVAWVRAEIKKIMGEVREKKLSRGDASILLQGCGHLLKAVSDGRRQEEHEELRRDVEELKQRFATRTLENDSEFGSGYWAR